uniref:EamA domain-containing protein n=1 Tax=viral metagenome TaxID=1070528 RepID=A0A6C0DVU2_9ZZZZ
MIAPNPTVAILYSELVLSLYPVLIKTVNTNIFTQILARFIAFPALALAFGSTHDFSAIWGNPYEAFVSILHNLLNLGHVAASYIAFKNLHIGTAISLFYLYPIFNIIAGSLLFGDSLPFTSILIIFIAFIGTYLIATSHKTIVEPDKDKRKRNFGVVMGILAAITETMIFIFVKSNTDAKASPYYTVNHLYPAGLAMLAAYGIFNKNIVDTSGLNWTKLLGFNALLGFTGYIARFYAIPKIPTIVFSLLSFFGVTFGYLWGVIFMGDKPTMKALIGGGLIAGSTAVLRYFGSV